MWNPNLITCLAVQTLRQQDATHWPHSSRMAAENVLKGIYPWSHNHYFLFTWRVRGRNPSDTIIWTSDGVHSDAPCNPKPRLGCSNKNSNGHTIQGSTPQLVHWSLQKPGTRRFLFFKSIVQANKRMDLKAIWNLRSINFFITELHGLTFPLTILILPSAPTPHNFEI